jgi:hypothetical protein
LQAGIEIVVSELHKQLERPTLWMGVFLSDEHHRHHESGVVDVLDQEVGEKWVICM